MRAPTPARRARVAKRPQLRTPTRLDACNLWYSGCQSGRGTELQAPRPRVDSAVTRVSKTTKFLHVRPELTLRPDTRRLPQEGTSPRSRQQGQVCSAQKVRRWQSHWPRPGLGLPMCGRCPQAARVSGSTWGGPSAPCTKLHDRTTSILSSAISEIPAGEELTGSKEKERGGGRRHYSDGGPLFVEFGFYDRAS